MQYIFKEKLLIVLYCSFVALIVVNYFMIFPVSGFLEKIFEVFLVFIFFLSCLLTGMKLSDILKFEYNNDIERFIYKTGLGVVILTIVIFFTGVFGLIYFAVFSLIVFLPFLIFIDNLKYIYQKLKNIKFEKEIFKINLITIILISLSIFSFVVIFISCFAPPTYYDSLVYHLSLPQLYIISKRIFNVSFNMYSYFPQNMEMLFMAGLLLGNEIVPNLISFVCFSFTIILCFSLYKEITDNKQTDEFEKIGPLIAIFLFITAPFNMFLSSSSYVETGLTFYTLLSVFAFLKYVRYNSKQWIILSGIFSGMAVGTKYTGAITPFILAIILIFRLKKYNMFIIMKEVTFFILPIILLYLPWGIRNLVYTGNPFFPFFYSVFGFKNVAWTTETASGYFSLLTEYQNKSVILTEIIKFPLNVINSPLKYGGGMDILGDFGWVVFFVIVPVVFIIKGFFNKVKNNISLYTMIVYIIGYFLLWFITKPVLRFLVPLSPFISVLSGLVFVEVLKFKINFVKITICFILFLFTLSNFLVYCSFQDVVKQFGVAVGLETKDEYLTKRLRNSPYPVLKFINENLDVQDTIFFVGEQRTFYCKKRFITSNLFAKNQLVKWADESVDVQEMLEKMKLEGITHILYNAEEGKRLESYGIFNFTENGRKNWETLLKKIKLLYSYNNVFLYSLM